ncbi:uncharacterized protein DNG_10501, partial [Cephalotrichum gorgonifer]
KIKKIKKTRKT